MRANRGSDRGMRQGRRLGSWLGMAALLLQLVVTAGHFHPEDFAVAAGDRSIANAAAQGGGDQPSGGQPGAPAHDDCALCFTLHLAGSSALPASAPLNAPETQEIAPPPLLGALRLAAAPYLLFRTRAPPIA